MPASLSTSSGCWRLHQLRATHGFPSPKTPLHLQGERKQQIGRASRWIPIWPAALPTTFMAAQFAEVQGINATITFSIMWITTLWICVNLLITSSTKCMKLVHLPVLFMMEQRKRTQLLTQNAEQLCSTDWNYSSSVQPSVCYSKKSDWTPSESLLTFLLPTP